jgi:hypothetical protein
VARQGEGIRWRLIGAIERRLRFFSLFVLDDDVNVVPILVFSPSFFPFLREYLQKNASFLALRLSIHERRKKAGGKGGSEGKAETR